METGPMPIENDPMMYNDPMMDAGFPEMDGFLEGPIDQMPLQPQHTGTEPFPVNDDAAGDDMDDFDPEKELAKNEELLEQQRIEESKKQELVELQKIEQIEKMADKAEVSTMSN